MSETIAPRTDAVVESAERRFRDLVHGLDAIVWEADAASLACTFVSQRAEELLGHPIESWLGSAHFWHDLVDARDRERVLARYAEALSAERPLEHEFRAVAADGRVVWLRDRVQPTVGGRLRGLMIDVTEHKRLEGERDELLLREQIARDEMESAAEMVQRLESITEAALSDLSMDHLLRRVLERIRDVLEADTTLILLPTDDGEHLALVDAVGLEHDDNVRVPMAESLSGRIARSRRALLLEDAARADVDVPALRRAQVRSLVGVPLSVDGDIVGVVHAARVAARRFSADDARLLQLVGDRLGVAIRNARLYEAERRTRLALEAAARRAAFLADAVTALAAAPDAAAGLAEVARLAVPLLADWCAVDLCEADGGFRRVAVVHADPADEARAAALLGPVAAPAGTGVTRALATGTLEWVGLDADPRDLAVLGAGAEPALVSSLGVDGYVVAPLVAGGRVLGAITLVAAPGREFGEIDARLAQDLARRAALALESVRRHGEARELLRMVGGELRAPLATLSRALRATADPARAGAIRTAARALSAVARETRAAARLVAGPGDVAGRRVDMARIVDAAVQAVAGQARARGVRVEAAIEPDGLEVAGDRRRLRQAAQRLLETAIRATPRGGRVRTRLSRAGARAVLAVSMVGATVAPTAGLRLSVARQLLEHDGGTLSAASEDQATPTLTVSLPLA
jgi:PAS domain S-box-containing protein